MLDGYVCLSMYSLDTKDMCSLVGFGIFFGAVAFAMIAKDLEDDDYDC